MTVVNIYEAKAHLSALIAEVEAGGDVVIARAGKPAVRLIRAHGRTEPRQPGSMAGRIVINDDFDTYDATIEGLFAGEGA